jgi:hypothetical protein
MCAELGHFLLTNRFERKKHIESQMDTHNINILSMTFNNTNIKTVRNDHTSPILHDLVINVGLELPVSSAAFANFPQMKVFVSFLIIFNFCL